MVISWKVSLTAYITLSILAVLVEFVEPAGRTIKIKLNSLKLRSPDNTWDTRHSILNIGQPPQSFKVIFDLASGEGFVPHYEKWKFNPFLHYDKGFRCSQSATCKKVSSPEKIQFMNSHLEGKVCRDNLQLTDRNMQTVNFPMDFLAVSWSSLDLNSLETDGFIGLGPIQSNPRGRPGFIQVLHRYKLIDNLQFSLWMSKYISSRSSGELILGGVDTDRYSGPISWHKVSSTDSWSLNLDGAYFGQNPFSCSNGTCKTILSSSFTGVYGPSYDIEKIYKYFDVDVRDKVPYISCAKILSAPDITFVIDGKQYRMPAVNYITDNTRSKCFLSLYPGVENLWVLGTDFLSGYYSIFDVTEGMIGFATPKLSLY